MHERQAIREAVIARLKGTAPAWATSARDRVYSSRMAPLRTAQLPAISVYVDSDVVDDLSKNSAPRELKRTVTIAVEGWVPAAGDTPVDDALDELALQIETAMDGDLNLAGTAFDSMLTLTEIGIKLDGDRPLACAHLEFAVDYHSPLRVAEPVDDLTTVAAQWTDPAVLPESAAFPATPWARWSLDSDWNDASGNGRHLTAPVFDVNGYPLLVEGRRGKARRFTRAGIDAAGVLPAAAPYRDLPVADLQALLANSYTIAAWVRPTTPTAGPATPVYSWVLWGVDGDTPAKRIFGGLRYTIGAAPQIVLTTQTPSSPTLVAGRASFYTRTLTLGQWYYVAAVVTPNANVSGSVRGANVAWYVNGALEFVDVGTGAAGPSMTDLNVSNPIAARLSLAGRQPNRATAGWSPTWNDGVDGDLDDPAIFARALTASEIALAFSAGHNDRITLET